jgi:hypothetical protein
MENQNQSGAALSSHALFGPYFGFATFDEYFASSVQRLSNAPAYTRPRSKQEVMDRILKRAGEAWGSVIEFIRGELERNPTYRTRPVWYFVMPEARGVIPDWALEIADSCGAGCPNVKEHAPLSAGASVKCGVDVETTEEHENRAADRGCCVSTCSLLPILGAVDLSEQSAILLVALVLGLAVWWWWSMDPRSSQRQSKRSQQASANSERDIKLPSAGLAYQELESLTLRDLLKSQDSSEYLQYFVAVDVEVDLRVSIATPRPSLSHHQSPDSSHS